MPNFEADSASTASAEKRQPRQSRLVKASLACDRLGRFDVTLRNISETGVGGQSPHVLQVGERLTVYLPGHQPMDGIIRWVSDKRFGLQTERTIEPARLRAAHADQLVAADSKAEFQIMAPTQMSTWRPGLRQVSSLPGHYGKPKI
ncbi:PilZ domain-containing protein [Sphingopyxis terrae subsp. ummariensis]